MGKSIQPFYVGQKVVCVDVSRISNDPDAPRINQQYTVTGVGRCIGCGWWVTVGIVDDNRTGYGVEHCGGCYALTPSDGSVEWQFDPSRFRAITDDFQAISFEKVVEEELVSMN